MVKYFLYKDISHNNSFLQLIVFSNDFLGLVKKCGQGDIFLRDRLYSDFLSHDVEIDLVPQGKIYIRITRIGNLFFNSFNRGN